MVWILLLSGADLSTHALTPGLCPRAFGVCLDLIGGEALASNQSLYLTRGTSDFGEYELSPSLIGLSLLHTPHREAFQRLSVRPSIPCYRDFSLDMCRSLGFASAAHD